MQTELLCTSYCRNLTLSELMTERDENLNNFLNLLSIKYDPLPIKTV